MSLRELSGLIRRSRELSGTLVSSQELSGSLRSSCELSGAPVSSQNPAPVSSQTLSQELSGAPIQKALYVEDPADRPDPGR